MSSVQDYDKCPQCDGIYVMDFDCRTLEEYRYCNRCGKRESHTIKKKKDGTVIRDAEGNVKYKYYSSFGFGCFAIQNRKGVRAIHNLLKPADDEIKQDFQKTIQDPDVDADHCYLTSWDPEEQKITAVFGRLPMSYDESMSDTEGDEAETA